MAKVKDVSCSILQGSTEFADHPCMICQARDKQEVESTNYCVDCNSNMCGACTRSHARFPAMASHQVVDISRAPGKPAQTLPLPTQRCDEHHGKLLDRYCEDHDVVACETCINMNHRNCIRLKYVPKFAKGIANTCKFEVISRSTDELLKALKQRRSLQREALQQLDKAEAKSQQNVNDQTEILHTFIDGILKSEYTKITSTYQEKRGALQKHMSILDDQIDSTETINDNLKGFQDENESEMFVYVKQGEKNDRDGKQMLEPLFQADLSIPTYTANNTIERSLKEITSFGEFQRTVTVKHNKDVYFGTASSVCKCNISRILILSDASMILVDNLNKKLKHVDASCRIISDFDMESNPWDICYTNIDELAVTLPWEKKVQFVCVDATIKLTRSFLVNDVCGGICYSNNELFICCAEDKPQKGEYVIVYNLSGTALRILQQPLFTDLKNITVSSCGKKLHVTDFNKGVLTVDRIGNLIDIYIDPELNGASGICTLENGDLLVCGFRSNNVHHISKDGRKRAVVLNEQDGIVNSWAICYDRDQSRLVLSTKRYDTIKVYDAKLV